MEINSKPLDFADYLITEGMIELRPLVNRCAAQCGRQISDNRILCMGCLSAKRVQFEAKLDQQKADRLGRNLTDAEMRETDEQVAAFGQEEAAAAMIEAHDRAVGQ